MIMNFPENLETVRENVREIAPQRVLYNSRQWDALVGTIQVRMAESSWLNRKLYGLFLPVGQRLADKTLAGEAIPRGCGSPTASATGASSIPCATSWASPICAPPTRAGARSARTRCASSMRWGINLKQIYGSTEVTGGGTIHYDGEIKTASVGRPAPGISVRAAEDGEIQIGGPTVFQGYYKNADATDEAIIEENGTRWFRTGDAGYIDEDGHLVYLDRMKDMITLANGERHAPQFIEGRLKFNPTFWT